MRNYILEMQNIERVYMKITIMKNKKPYCTKCGKPAHRVLNNPNQWKKYSRNNDSIISACCEAKIIWK